MEEIKQPLGMNGNIYLNERRITLKENLNEIVIIINKLKQTSSKKDKEKIMKENSNNELFKKILFYTYNTDLKYGIQKKSIIIKHGDSKWDSLFDMLDELSKANINDNLRINVGNFLGNIEENDEQELVVNILLKDLRCNINIKSINKAIPGIIQQHQVMLASKFEGKLKEEVSMSLKLDGIRNSAIIDNGIIHKSRQGKVVEGLNQINQALESLNLDGYFVDGELIRINKDGMSSDDNFRLTTTIVNSKSDNKEGLEFVIFDMTPVEDYYRGKCDLTYKERLKLMEDKIGNGNEFIKLVPKFGTTKDVNVIYDKLNEVVKKQLEGLMLNTLNGKYEFGKRPKSIMKVKKFQDGDVLVTDIIEGEGRLTGTLGKVEIQFKYKDNIYTNYLGSGFSDEERNYYWGHKEELIGKVITISYFEISKNKQGEYGFRFATWKGREYIRFDKEGIDDTNIE